MTTIKQIGETEIIMDFSLNIPMGYVFSKGEWTVAPVQDNSKEINIVEHMEQKTAEYISAHPVEEPVIAPEG